MQTRRQEKVGRVVKEAVSDAVANHLGDPRIAGFVSITRVEMAPDLRSADVYLSIFGGDEVLQKKTFLAINHARTKIQSFLSSRMTGKFCPVLQFHMDEIFKKTLETMKIINEAVGDLDKDSRQQKNGIEE